MIVMYVDSTDGVVAVAVNYLMVGVAVALPWMVAGAFALNHELDK